eukprot:jgi/Mesen1/8432/ME000473S07775
MGSKEQPGAGAGTSSEDYPYDFVNLSYEQRLPPPPIDEFADLYDELIEGVKRPATLRKYGASHGGYKSYSFFQNHVKGLQDAFKMQCEVTKEVIGDGIRRDKVQNFLNATKRTTATRARENLEDIHARFSMAYSRAKHAEIQDYLLKVFAGYIRTLRNVYYSALQVR